MIGTLINGEHIRNTHIRFTNVEDFENFNNYIDEGYDSEGTKFNGCIYKLNTAQFNLVK